MIKQTFFELIALYKSDYNLQIDLWNEIEQAYNHKKRHYHTLAHLESLLHQLLIVKFNIADWDTILFTLYYHDIVYNVSKTNNEEESALLAEQRMAQLSVPAERIKKCKSQILATKSHKPYADNDTNYFTDADLSILGKAWEKYLLYTENVRKEYAIYPYLMYKEGRKKVLANFLSMETIFKTAYFYNKFEEQAKLNLKRELATL